MFFFSSRRRHTRYWRDWSSDVCSSDLPGSALARRQPDWVMAAELVETSRLWGRTAARIDPAWIEPLAGHLVRRMYDDPYWRSEERRVGKECRSRWSPYH